MYKFFKYFSAILFVVGFLLIGLSFFVSVSIWYGIEIMKSGFYILIIGMFFNLMEHTSSKCKNEKVRKSSFS